MIAVGATAVAQTRIGNYSLLSAGSFLTKNIPDGDIFVGTPAKFLKHINMGGQIQVLKFFEERRVA